MSPTLLRRLFKRAAAGDQRACDEIATAYQHLAIITASKQRRGQKVELEDLVGTMNIALITAIRNYDPRRGAWASYAIGSLRRAALEHVRQVYGRKSAVSKRPEFTSLDAADIYVSDTNVEGEALDSVELGALHDAIEQLPVQIRTAMIDQLDELTITDSAKRARLSKTRIAQLRQAGLERLKRILDPRP